MPAVVPAISAAFTAINTFAASSAIAGFLVNTVSSIALSALATAIAGKPDVPQPGITTETTTAGGTIPQRLIFGTYATAGQMVAPMMVYQTDGNPNEWLVYVISLADKPVTGLGRIFIDGKALEIDGDPAASAHGDAMGATVLDTPKDSLRNKVYIRFHDGNQMAADAYLRRVFADYPERPWTADMIGKGVAYAVVTFKGKAQDGNYSGFPSIKFEVDGHKLVDPRDGQERFTRNPAVIAWNILRGIDMPGGDRWGVGTRDFVMSHVLAAANLCDSNVPSSEPGGTRVRYQAGLEVSVSDEPHEALMEFVKAMGGDVADMGGTWLLSAGEPSGPVLSITDDDIIVTDSRSLKPYPGLDETVNAVHATYPDPAQQWEAKEAIPLYNAAYEVKDGGRRLIAEVDFPSVPYQRQVRTLMREMLADHRRMRTHVITLPPDALGLRLGEHIAWSSVTNGYIGKLFKVVAKRVDTQSLCVALTITERDPSDYDYDAGSDNRIPTVPSSDPVVPIISGITGWNVEAVNAGGRPGIRMSWNPDINARALSWVIRLASDGSETNSGTTSDMARGENVQAAGLKPSTDYLVTGRLVIPGRGTESVTVAVTTLAIGLTWADLQGEVRDDVASLEDWAEGTGGYIREIRDEIDGMLGEVLEGDSHAFVQREVIRREVGEAQAAISSEAILRASADGALSGRVDEVTASLTGKADASALNALVVRVEDAEDGISAQADAITTVSARTDRGTATGLFRVTAESAPSGVQTRIGIRAEASAGAATHSAAMYLDAKSDGTSQALFQANRFAILTGPTAAPQVPFVVDGSDIYMDAAVWIKDLSVDTIKVKNNAFTTLSSVEWPFQDASGSSWVTIQSLTFPTYSANSKLMIGGVFSLVANTGNLADSGSVAYFRVVINGDVVKSENVSTVVPSGSDPVPVRSISQNILEFTYGKQGSSLLQVQARMAGSTGYAQTSGKIYVFEGKK